MHIALIALHYGPEGSGGARRPTLYAQELRRRGCRVRVVTPYPTHVDDVEVPHPARPNLSRASIEGPDITERLKRPLRKLRYWPDPDVQWAYAALDRVGWDVVHCDWILTTSPPESAHQVGYEMAQQLSAKWCAEFRDTWFTRPHRRYVKGPRAAIERTIARRWLSRADALTAVDDTVLSDVKPLFRDDVPAAVIGHFSSPFTGEAVALPEDDFNLVHSGGFTRSDHRRKLEPLLARLSGVRDDLHLHVAGPMTTNELARLEAAPFKATHHGWLDLEASRALQAGADALLLHTPERTDALPGKYAEYLLARKPIVFAGADNVRGMAHRANEFIELEGLARLRKGEMRAPETQMTVEAATDQLLDLLSRS